MRGTGVVDASGVVARSAPPMRERRRRMTMGVRRDRLRAATASVALLVAVFVAGAAVQTAAAPAVAGRSPAVADAASAPVGLACAPVPPRTQRVHLMGKRVPVTDGGFAVAPRALLAVRPALVQAIGSAAQVPLGSHVLAGHQGRAPPL
jgi:hypothetical protein